MKRGASVIGWIGSSKFVYDEKKLHEEKPMGFTATSLLFALVLSASVALAWNGSGTYEDPYEIATLQDLQDLATAVNGGASQSGVYFLQTADIDLSSVHSWGGIGTISADLATTNAFSGDYDGNGYCISNMTIAVSNSSDGRYFFGLFGYAEEASLSNIKTHGKISVYDSTDTAFIYVGGVAASVKNCLLEALENGCDINFHRPNVSDSETKRSNIGGVIGRMKVSSNMTYLGLKNYGKIYSVSPWRISVCGIVGDYYRGDHTALATMKGWENHGSISSSSSSSSAASDSSSSSSSAHICGFAYCGQIGNTTFNRCVNYADLVVSGGCYLATGGFGLIGSNNPSGKPTYCENRGNIYLYEGDGHAQGFYGFAGGDAYQGQSYSYNTNYGNIRIEGKVAGRYEIGGISGVGGYAVSAWTINDHCANYGTLEYIGTNTSGREEVSIGGIQAPKVLQREYCYITRYSSNFGTLKLSSQNKSATTKLGIGGVVAMSSPNGNAQYNYPRYTLLNSSANFGKLIMNVPDDFEGVADISGVCAAYSERKCDVRINWSYNLGEFKWSGRNIRIGGIMGLQDAEVAANEFEHINHSYSICSYNGSTNGNYVGTICGYSQAVTAPVTVSNSFGVAINRNLPAFGYFDNAYTNNVKGYAWGEVYRDLNISGFYLPSSKFNQPSKTATFFDLICPMNTEIFPTDTDEAKRLHNAVLVNGYKRYIRTIQQ